MSKKIVLIITILALATASLNQISDAKTIPGEIYEGESSILYRNVTVYAPAVASTESGYRGVISTITVTVQNNGSGRVFVDTLPLTQVDMQGSARLAVKVASALVRNEANSDINPSTYDYFFVVRTESPIIGGPSAGAIMTVATISLLKGWELSNKTVMTGMINPDGSIGPIGGIPQKIDAAFSVGATHFLIPYGQGTYTEYVQSIERINGWERIVTTPITRKISEYASQYNMMVTEVADINEALENFTGYRFFFNETDSKITTEDYITSMKPLAISLLNDAQEALNNATSHLENTTIPNYPYTLRSTVNDRYSVAKVRLNESEEWFNKGLYYTSTSKSFNSLILSRFITYACDFFNSDSNQFFEDLLTEAQTKYNQAIEQAKNADIIGYISLQSVGAAQRRAAEAKRTLDSAISSYENRNPFSFDTMNFIYNIAFIIERCNSVGWWLSIGSFFNETGELNNEAVENLALEYIEEAEQASFYSNIILNEIGSSSSSQSLSYLTSAEEILNFARNNLDNDLSAASIFDSLEATIRANLAIEILGTEPIDKIDLARESASNKITNCRNIGIEPILAVSYYEYGESLNEESDYQNALLYFKFGGMIAGSLGFTNVNSGTATSRYVGSVDVPVFTTGNWLSENIEFIVTFAALTALIGLGIGFIISGLVFKNQDKHKKFGREKQKYSGFKDNEIPRSIRDYYEKMNRK
jgi:uncharacterized protein